MVIAAVLFKGLAEQNSAYATKTGLVGLALDQPRLLHVA